jgi:hypothetical protein
MHRTTVRLFTVLALLLVSISMLTRSAHADPAISAQGYTWIDSNCDGVRQDTEPAAGSIMPIAYLYSFGPDGVPFTSDDRQVGVSGIADTYAFTTSSASPYLMRVSIIQGTRPDGHMPTKFHQGGDSTRWSDLQDNWTTPGFLMNPNATVNSGNLGIAPISACVATFLNKVNVPLVMR